MPPESILPPQWPYTNLPLLIPQQPMWTWTAPVDTSRIDQLEARVAELEKANEKLRESRASESRRTSRN